MKSVKFSLIEKIAYWLFNAYLGQNPKNFLVEGAQWIPISKITLSSYLQELGRETDAELTSRIRKEGVLEAVIVESIDGAKFQLLCGGRRLQSCKELGMWFIPAIIKA